MQAQARGNVCKEAIAADPDPMAVQAGPIAADPAVIHLRKRYRDADARLQQHDQASARDVPDARRESRVGCEAGAMERQIDLILRGAQAGPKEIERSETGIQQAMAQAQQQSQALCREEMESRAWNVSERAGRSDTGRCWSGRRRPIWIERWGRVRRGWWIGRGRNTGRFE